MADGVMLLETGHHAIRQTPRGPPGCRRGGRSPGFPGKSSFASASTALTVMITAAEIEGGGRRLSHVC
jgi:hypothetical protein